MAQISGKRIQKRFKHVDIVFGTHQWKTLPTLIEKARVKQERALEVDLFGWDKYSFLPFHKVTGRYKVCELVTVQNGCDKFCTFCVVPYTRGRQVSRDLDEIIQEVSFLSEQGVKEVTLLGQNVNAYGHDKSSDLGFMRLLEEVSKVDGIERIRFVTSHPDHLTYDMIDRMADMSKLCQSIHLPIQSGSDKILSLMNRNYNKKMYVELANYMRKKIKNVTISSDIIVGFPGESEEDFEQTLQVVKEVGFEESYSSCYSPRPGTKSAKWLDDHVDVLESKHRLARLKELQLDLTMQAKRQLIGQTLEVLVEAKSHKHPNRFTGKTRENWLVSFEGQANDIGRLVLVRAQEVLTKSILAVKIQSQSYDLPLAS